MYSIHYFKQAQTDLDEAIAYIAKDSVQYALEYLQGYEEKIDLLKQNPNMGVECRVKQVNRDCRIIVYKSHIIVYRINDVKKEIWIIRIFHASVNYPDKLNSN